MFLFRVCNSAVSRQQYRDECRAVSIVELSMMYPDAADCQQLQHNGHAGQATVVTTVIADIVTACVCITTASLCRRQ